ncbi:MAG: ribosome assembly RNA-binding protein YhbY [Myxococcota bacterium]
MELTSAQRRHLRGLAHHLDPVVQIGGAGLTEGVVRSVEEALAARELIKVKLEADRDERGALAVELSKALTATVAQQIGKVVVLYRPHKEPKKRKIALPED